MTTTITRLFDDRRDAENAARELETMGVDRADISIVASGSGNSTDGTAANGDHHDITDINDHGDVSRGTSTGALIGGAGGLLAGLGLLAIPGLGPIVAAGWLLSTVAGAGIGAAGGAATGSIVGALKNAGHSDDDANVYSEGVRRGSTLVSARIPDEMASQAQSALQRFNSVDAATRGPEYRSSGWTRFDENAGPYQTEHASRSVAGSVSGGVGSVGDKVAGLAKEGFGKATGDVDLERRGEVQQQRAGY